jgi:hypothetical protein
LNIQSSSCAIICNLVIDFSSIKKLIVDNNHLTKIIQFLSSMDYNLRLNSIFLLKNLIFKIESDYKKIILKQIEKESLIQLINDEQISIQEQTLIFFRNFLSGNKLLLKIKIGSVLDVVN